MKSQTRLRLTGTFTLLGFAVLVTQAMAWMLSTVVNSAYGSVSPFWFVVFGALTMPFVITWIRKDAARAYETATNTTAVDKTKQEERSRGAGSDTAGRGTGASAAMSTRPARTRWSERRAIGGGTVAGGSPAH